MKCSTRKELAARYGLSTASFKRLLDKLGCPLPVRRVLLPGEVAKIVKVMDNEN